MSEHSAYISEMYDFWAEETDLTPTLKRKRWGTYLTK